MEAEFFPLRGHLHSLASQSYIDPFGGVMKTSSSSVSLIARNRRTDSLTDKAGVLAVVFGASHFLKTHHIRKSPRQNEAQAE